LLQYYKENIQLFLILTIWLIVGIYGGPLIYGVLPITMFLMQRKDMYEELLLGYLFILILSDSQEGALYFAKEVKNIYISLLAVFIYTDRKDFQPFDSLYKIFIPFFVISLITISFSTGDSFFLTGVQKTISFLLSFIVIPNIVLKLYRESAAQFLRRFVLFIFMVLVIGFLLKYILPETALLLGERYRGIFGGPNGLGVFCLLSFITFFVINNFFPDLFSKNERILIFGIILLSVFYSGSRNAVISVLIFYIFQRFFSLSPFLGFILFLVAIFITDLISSNATAIILSLGLGDYFRTNTIEEGSGRYIAWAFAWNQIQNNFFIGKGFAYNEFYMRHHYGELLKLNHQGGIHNSFLTFWMDQGLVGLLIYLYSYILMFIKAAQKSKFAFPIMFAISFSAFFESWLVGSLSPFAFMGMFVFTIITTEEILPQRDEIETRVKEGESKAQIAVV
jgi:O-antigen ligase